MAVALKENWDVEAIRGLLESDPEVKSALSRASCMQAFKHAPAHNPTPHSTPQPRV